MERQDVQKLARGTTVTFFGGAAGSGLNYLAGVAISRLVGPQLLGAYYLCLTVVQLGSNIARLGFSDALLRFVPPAVLAGNEQEPRRIVRTVLGTGWLAGLVLAGLGFGVIWSGARAVSMEPLFIQAMRWFVWTIPLHVLFILLLMAIQARQRMSYVVMARDLVQPLLLVGITVGLVVLGPPLLGLVGGWALSLILSIALAAFFLGRLAPGTLRPGARAPLRPILAFSLPVLLGDVSHYAYRWIDTFAVGYFLDLRQVGIYSAALRTSLLIMLVVAAANAIYATLASGYFHTGQTGSVEKAYVLSTRWTLLLAFPLLVLFLVGADWVLLLWGEEFREGSSILQLLAVAQIVGVPMVILAYTLVMCGRQKLEAFNTIALLPVILGLNVLFIPRMGLMGAGVSLAISNLVGVLIRGIQVRRLLGLRPFRLGMVKPMIAGVVAWGAGTWFHGAAGSMVSAAQPGSGAMLAHLAALLALFLIIAGSFLLVALVLGLETEDRELVRILRRRRSTHGQPGDQS
jgi:O-antigen/teichoic acid export membrane protein